MSRAWLFGASINLVGSIMINLGTNVMKLGHNRRAAAEHRLGKKVPIRIFREWQIGVVFFIVGNLANFISFGYAAQSLLAALGSVQFVSNVAFASLVLKEKVTKTILCATGCIVSGCVMLVLFGSHASKQFTVNEMMHLYTEPAYIAYLIFLGSIVLSTYCIYKQGKKKMLSVGVSGLNHYWYRMLPVSYATFSGMIGTQSVLFSKTLSTLLRVTLGGNSQLRSWFTWVILALFLITSTFWVSRLNKALKFFPAMMIVPTMQISWTFFSIVSGMLYFQEYKDFTLLNGIMFIVAVMIVFFGVFLLTKVRVIEQRFSTRFGDTFQEDKQRDQSESEESQTSRIETNGMLEPSVVSWDDLEDVRSPMVDRDHTDSLPGDRSDLSSKGNASLNKETKKNRLSSKSMIEENGNDGNMAVRSKECPPCSKGCLLEDAAEDFSLDIWSSVKGTVGMGSGMAPAVTLFGPPGIGLERRSSIRLNANCNAVVDPSATETMSDAIPIIVHLANEAPLRKA